MYSMKALLTVTVICSEKKYILSKTKIKRWSLDMASIIERKFISNAWLKNIKSIKATLNSVTGQSHFPYFSFLFKGCQWTEQIVLLTCCDWFKLEKIGDKLLLLIGVIFGKIVKVVWRKLHVIRQRCHMIFSHPLWWKSSYHTKNCPKYYFRMSLKLKPTKVSFQIRHTLKFCYQREQR